MTFPSVSLENDMADNEAEVNYWGRDSVWLHLVITSTCISLVLFDPKAAGRLVFQDGISYWRLIEKIFWYQPEMLHPDLENWTYKIPKTRKLLLTRFGIRTLWQSTIVSMVPSGSLVVTDSVGSGGPAHHCLASRHWPRGVPNEPASPVNCHIPRFALETRSCSCSDWVLFLLCLNLRMTSGSNDITQMLLQCSWAPERPDRIIVC